MYTLDHMQEKQQPMNGNNQEFKKNQSDYTRYGITAVV